MKDKAYHANLEIMRILAALIAIVYAGSVGWMAALGETVFAYYGGLLTICTYGLVVFFTMRMKKAHKILGLGA